MGGLFASPPAQEWQPPDIPVPDFKSTAQQSVAGAIQAGIWDDLIAKLYAAFAKGLSVVIAFLMGGMDDLLALALKFVTAAQATNQPGFFALVAAVLTDLLGVEFSSDTFQAAFTQHGTIASVTAMGGSLYGQLTKEFSAGQAPGQLQPTPAPAEAFLGFLISFAVRQGNVAFISRLIPEEFNPIGGLREYGETLARNLGLGRLARRALQPLIQILVADPLQWSLNAQYRPKLLDAAQLVRAYYRGALSNDDVNRYLAWQGYPDWAIGSVFADYGHIWTVGQLRELYRLGLVTDNDASAALVKTGMTLDDATNLWTATKTESLSPLVHRYLSEAMTQAHSGLILYSDVTALLDTAPLMPEERDWWRHIIGQMSEHPRKLLTESELEKAYLEGIIDLTTCQDHWAGVGYSPAAVQTLTLLLLNKQAAGNRTGKGHVPHKTLTEAQLEKAYNSGILDLAQLQAGWQALGYSANDQLVLAQLVQIKLPGPGTTTLPGLTTP